jgi:putative addiction module component (TIGR02574 family)
MVTDRARRLLEDAKTLSAEERADLAAELLATLPSHTAEQLHPEWLVELERRARRAWADPDGGEPWDAVEQRLLARTLG